MPKTNKGERACCKNPKNWEDYALMGDLSCASQARVMYKCKKCGKEMSGDYNEYRNIYGVKKGDKLDGLQSYW